MSRYRAVLGAAVVAVTLMVGGCLRGPGWPWTDAGPTVSEERTIPAVTSVILRTPGEVMITTGAEPSLTVTAPEGILDRLTSTVDGDVLVLDSRDRLGRPGPVVYDLVLPTVETISLTGSGSVRVDGVKGADLTLDVRGSGSLRIEAIAVRDLDLAVAGSGSAVLEGSADRHRATVSGSGRVDATRLETAETAVSISGSGRADVTATETLVARVSGSGRITHAGGARVDATVSGSGVITARP